MNCPNSSGVLAMTSKPIPFRRSRISGERSAFTAASLSLSTTSRGVLAGAPAACQDVTTRSEKPASAIVGTSGSWAARVFAVTASARILPALSWVATVPRFWNDASTCPPSRSVTTAAPPLYGTWMPLVPVIWAKSSKVRWSDDPVPLEPNETLPGFFRISSSSSFTDFAGKSSLVTSTFGVVTARVIGAKSRTGW